MSRKKKTQAPKPSPRSAPPAAVAAPAPVPVDPIPAAVGNGAATTMAVEPSKTTYDEVPYASHPFPQTHPERLAVIATLFHLHPPAIDRCRVLELGCASGGNLIPMAVSLPNSQFVGIDLSSRQVADGQKLLDGLQLKNIELKAMSILDVAPDFGQFDYILCHGVFSWVPRVVQDKILDICKQNLAPNGIAYVSYNVYPGWHMRGMIRDMMYYHGQNFGDPQVRVQQARALIDFLARSVANQNTPYSVLLKSELELITKVSDSYLLHEHLEEVNEPTYFRHFAERAMARGLRYLGEAEVGVMVLDLFAPEVRETLRRLSSDLIRLEQYMDFVRNRMFRQTLLCHNDLNPSYALNPQQLKNFKLASPAKPTTSPVSICSTQQVRFQGPREAFLNSTDPLTKAAMTYLTEQWPLAVPFDTLLDHAREKLVPLRRSNQPPLEEDVQAVGVPLLNCFASGLVELRLRPDRFTRTVSDRPQACPLARLQAETGSVVSSRQHQTVTLGELDRQVLRHLDGQRDQATLHEALIDLTNRSILVLRQNDQVLRDPQLVSDVLRQGLKESLERLANAALLVA